MPSLSFIRRHRGAILSIVLLFLVPVLTNLLASALVTIIGNTLRWLLVAIVLLACLSGVFYIFYHYLGSSPQRLVLDDEMPQQRKGLIALVGKKSQKRDPVADAIEYHLRDANGRPVLRTCWLIATEGTEGSIGVALEYQQVYQERGVDVQICKLRSAFDVQEAFDLVQHVYQEKLGDLHADEVIADITGGTGLMTAGMVLACAMREAAMQYMTGGRPEIASCPIEIAFRSD